jgi:hypothetical protein
VVRRALPQQRGFAGTTWHGVRAARWKWQEAAVHDVELGEDGGGYKDEDDQADDGEFRRCELGGEAVEGVSSRGRVVVVMDAFLPRSIWAPSR